MYIEEYASFCHLFCVLGSMLDLQRTLYIVTLIILNHLFQHSTIWSIGFVGLLFDVFLVPA